VASTSNSVNRAECAPRLAIFRLDFQVDAGSMTCLHFLDTKISPVMTINQPTTFLQLPHELEREIFILAAADSVGRAYSFLFISWKVYHWYAPVGKSIKFIEYEVLLVGYGGFFIERSLSPRRLQLAPSCRQFNFSHTLRVKKSKHCVSKAL
jgi:hypothetical protein